MRKVLVSIIAILVTTFSLSIRADVNGSPGRVFQDPPSNSNVLLPNHPEWRTNGMTPSSCAQIREAAFTTQGRWPSGHGPSVCFYGLVALYGEAMRQPAPGEMPPPLLEGEEPRPAPRRGSQGGIISRALFEELFAQCTRYENDNDPTLRGCMKSSSATSADPNFISAPAPLDSAPVIAPALAPNALPIGAPIF